jgi:hypothetical protein
VMYFTLNFPYTLLVKCKIVEMGYYVKLELKLWSILKIKLVKLTH